MSYVILYGPRQHPDEASYAEQEPFSTCFKQQENKHLSRTELKRFIDDLVSMLQTAQYPQNWVGYHYSDKDNLMNAKYSGLSYKTGLNTASTSPLSCRSLRWSCLWKSCGRGVPSTWMLLWKTRLWHLWKGLKTKLSRVQSYVYFASHTDNLIQLPSILNAVYHERPMFKILKKVALRTM
jgi:hypothetical protein